LGRFLERGSRATRRFGESDASIAALFGERQEKGKTANSKPVVYSGFLPWG
jgi:hypothetical protein